MLATKLTIAGVERLLAELEHLAPGLTAEAVTLQKAIAVETAAAIRAAYPSDTGRLRASVQVSRLSSTSPARVFSTLTVTAPYAEYVEFGTATRTATPAFVPQMRIGRERFAEAVIARVKARGLVVGGDLR
jgi:HK97 gp10 family phage protein